MLSSDSNIETIAQLVEELKKYAVQKTEYMRLSTTEKTVRLLKSLIMAFIIFVLVLLILTYLSFAAAFALEPFVGTAAAFAIVAAVYFLLLIVCFIKRKRWIERPLVRFLASILIN